jgi:2-desacetyl-2-hydroxyethyl bacteriochlorophyllide A dehydrogenase
VVKGIARYVVSPEENVYHLPDSLPLRAAALAEPVACCLRGMDLLGVRHGESVALVGFGAIGAIVLQMLRSAGAGEIAVVEYNEERRALAMEMGADVFIPSQDTAAIENYAETHVVDRVIECVGKSAAHEIALRIAGRGATVVMFGVADSATKTEVSFYDAFSKELTIKTSFVNPHTTERAVRLLASGALDVERILAAEIAMEDAAEELLTPSLSRRGKVLVAVDPTLEN